MRCIGDPFKLGQKSDVVEVCVRQGDPIMWFVRELAAVEALENRMILDSMMARCVNICT